MERCLKLSFYGALSHMLGLSCVPCKRVDTCPSFAELLLAPGRLSTSLLLSLYFLGKDLHPFSKITETFKVLTKS